MRSEPDRATSTPGVEQLGAQRLLVVDDDPVVAGPIDVRAVGVGLHQRDELVAEVDERHLPTAAAQRELKPPLVPGQGLVEVGHLERHVVDSDRANRHVRQHMPCANACRTFYGGRQSSPAQSHR